MTNGRPIDPRLATLLRQGMTSRLVPEDEEQSLEMQIQVREGKVYLVMSKAVPWFGLTPEQARNLAGALVEGADAVERKDEPLVGNMMGGEEPKKGE